MVLAHIEGLIEVDSLHDFIIQYYNDSRFKEAIWEWSKKLYEDKGILIDDIIDAEDNIDAWVEHPDLELEEILKMADGTYMLENKEPYGYRIIEVLEG